MAKLKGNNLVLLLLIIVAVAILIIGGMKKEALVCSAANSLELARAECSEFTDGKIYDDLDSDWFCTVRSHGDLGCCGSGNWEFIEECDTPGYDCTSPFNGYDGQYFCNNDALFKCQGTVWNAIDSCSCLIEDQVRDSREDVCLESYDYICMDTDGGDKPYLKGIVEWEIRIEGVPTESGSDTDNCNGNILTEYYCDDFGMRKFKAYSCEVCSNGECTSGSYDYICLDSDGGKKPNTYGYVEWEIKMNGQPVDSGVYYDACLTGVVERYCDVEGRAQYEEMSCIYGCAAGKCKSEPGTPDCDEECGNWGAWSNVTSSCGMRTRTCESGSKCPEEETKKCPASDFFEKYWLYLLAAFGVIVALKVMNK